MASRNEIKAELGLDVTNFRKGVNAATGQVQKFGKDLRISLTTFGGRQFDGVVNGFTAIKVAAAAAAVGGVYAFVRAADAAIQKSAQFETAAFQMTSSLEAANRQFKLGTASEWEERIKQLGNTLKIYSETELRNAAAKTIDMTKRLGLSAKEMEKVIQVAGDLGAGKFELTDSVERVTAALRGEAEASEMLGLTLNEDYVKGWYSAKKSHGTAWKDLTDLQKAQARYQILLEQAGPKLGQAGKSLSTYASRVKVLENNYGDVQKEAGNLFTQNTFVTGSLGVLSDALAAVKENLVANRAAYVALVKDGIISLVSGVSLAIEIARGFYNAWHGLGIVAHGATFLMVKGMELTFTAIRGALAPLDLLLSGMEKIGAIDQNPLKGWEQTMRGISEISFNEMNAKLDEVVSGNAKFDAAKAKIEEFKAKIAEIPAEIKKAEKPLETQKEKTAEVGKEVALIGGVWSNTYSDAEGASAKATGKMLADIEKVKKAAAEIKYPTLTNSSAPGYQTGGPIKGFSTGGPFFGALRGYGGGDRRLAWLEDGEHVIRKEGVRALGHTFFQKFNNLRFLQSLPRFATGGPTGAAAAPATAAAGATFNVGPFYVTGSSQADIDRLADKVMLAFKRKFQGRSA